jgi:hypothetical protein
MEAYMGRALFSITVDAMKSDTDEVALQGIEFWSNVCDEEVDLQIEASEAAEEGRPPEHVSRLAVLPIRYDSIQGKFSFRIAVLSYNSVLWIRIRKDPELLPDPDP